jgi:uncharacterized iron-regulated protein
VKYLKEMWMLLKFWGWFSALSVALLVAPGLMGVDGRSLATPMPAAASINPENQSFLENTVAANARVLQAIAPNQIIYLAETHDTAADHIAQLEIIQALSLQGDVAIGLEMFQRPFQPVLDAYLAGSLTEEALIADSEYETRWGFDWAFYAPILQYAKAHQIPLIALNTPTEVTRKVASEGLESLACEDFTYIPAVDSLDLADGEYRRSLQEAFSAHGGVGHSSAFDNFFAAQVLWDETMAERLVEQLVAQRNRQIVVLVGEGHVVNGYGIPSRVARRLPNVAQASVRLVAADETIVPDETDFVWVTGAN